MAPGPIRTRFALRRHAKEGRSQDVRFRTRKTTSQEGDAAKIWRDSMSEVPASRQPGRPGTAPGSGESPVITDNMSNHTPSAKKANVQQRRQKRQASNSPPTAKARARKRTTEQEQRSRSAKQSGKTPIGNPVIRQRKTLQAETKVPLAPPSLSQGKNREVPGDTSVEEPISEVQSNSETGEGASEQIPPVSYPASGHLPPLAGSDILATADNSEEEPVCLGSSFSFSDTGSMESRGLLQEGSHGQPAKVADQASKSRYGPDQASPSGPTVNPREEANEEPLEERIARIISQTPLEERITRIVRQAMQEIGGSGPLQANTGSEKGLPPQEGTEGVEAIGEDNESGINGSAGKIGGQRGMFVLESAVQFLSTEPQNTLKQSQLPTTDFQAPRGILSSSGINCRRCNNYRYKCSGTILMFRSLCHSTLRMPIIRIGGQLAIRCPHQRTKYLKEKPQDTLREEAQWEECEDVKFGPFPLVKAGTELTNFHLRVLLPCLRLPQQQKQRRRDGLPRKISNQ